MKTILAIDLGKFKSCFCTLDTQTGEQTFSTEKSSREDFYRIFKKVQNDNAVVLFEAGSQAGWVADMLRQMKIAFKAANVTHPAWSGKIIRVKVTKKTPRG